MSRLGIPIWIKVFVCFQCFLWRATRSEGQLHEGKISPAGRIYKVCTTSVALEKDLNRNILASLISLRFIQFYLSMSGALLARTENRLFHGTMERCRNL
ncbi:hypothetical protein BDZ97DRAFT_57217 [Flammula alnicola]|nr:hypothetical protein BDZ97DRAFT_57217 [Flammula alnicola]